MREYTLAATEIVAERGLAWRASLTADFAAGDSGEHLQRSTLILFEDNDPLVPAHMSHDYIRDHGRGAYSHWHGSLYFSTSNGSDPRSNGRSYRIFADAAAASAALGRDVVAWIEAAILRRYEEDSLGGRPSATPYNQTAEAFGDPLVAAEDDKQIFEVWTKQLETWAGRSMGLNILELGPGLSLGVQALLAERGNSVTVADPFPPSWNAEFHPVVYRHLAQLIGGSAALECAAEGECFARIDVRQIDEPAEALSSLRDQEFDIVLSNATLEHIANLDRVCAELARVTKRGGLNMHQIDLAYHKDRARPLNHLLYSEGEFLAEATAANFEFGNRWRRSEFLARFKRAGFAILHESVNLEAKPCYLTEFDSLRAARGRYRRWPLDDLRALSIFLVARRPTAARGLISALNGHALVGIQTWRKRAPLA